MVVRWLIAILSWIVALSFAGFTGMFFEESKIVFSEGKAKSAALYSTLTIGAGIIAVVLCFIGISLVKR